MVGSSSEKLLLALASEGPKYMTPAVKHNIEKQNFKNFITPSSKQEDYKKLLHWRIDDADSPVASVSLFNCYYNRIR